MIEIDPARRYVGYARVSTPDQDSSGQVTRLKDVGANRVFEDIVSGKQLGRPGLSALMDHVRPGDSLVITRLDRLGVPSKNSLKLAKT